MGMPCERKVRYLTETTAAKGLAQMLDRFPHPKADRERLNAYRCSQCGFWHVGKNTPPKGRRAG